MHCVSRGGCYLVNSYCDLQEEDRWSRQSYQANWLNLVRQTRPQHKLTLVEKDFCRRESYEQQQVVHFLVEMTPIQILRLGKQGGPMMEHQLPFTPTLPTTLIRCSSVDSPRHQHQISPALGPPPAWQSILVENNGVCVDKQKVANIIKDLPKVTQPVRVKFNAFNLMWSPMEASHRLQRRE